MMNQLQWRYTWMPAIRNSRKEPAVTLFMIKNSAARDSQGTRKQGGQFDQYQVAGNDAFALRDGGLIQVRRLRMKRLTAIRDRSPAGRVGKHRYSPVRPGISSC